MVVMDARDLEVSLGLRVKTEYLAGKALQDDQDLPAAKACLEIRVYLVVRAGRE